MSIDHRRLHVFMSDVGGCRAVCALMFASDPERRYTTIGVDKLNPDLRTIGKPGEHSLVNVCDVHGDDLNRAIK